MQIWAIVYLYGCNGNRFSTGKAKHPPGKNHPFLQHTALDLSRGPTLLTITARMITSATISQKSSCDSQNIFFPPSPMTFKVVLLLPAAPDGRRKHTFTPSMHTHTHTERLGGGCRQAQNKGVAFILLQGYAVLPPTVKNGIASTVASTVVYFFPVLDVNRTNLTKKSNLFSLVRGNRTFFNSKLFHVHN